MKRFRQHQPSATRGGRRHEKFLRSYIPGAHPQALVDLYIFWHNETIGSECAVASSITITKNFLLHNIVKTRFVCGEDVLLIFSTDWFQKMHFRGVNSFFTPLTKILKGLEYPFAN